MKGPGIILITGGARSGKTGFALKEAERHKGKRLYIATAEPLDAEMEARIAVHRKERGEGWETKEEPVKIGDSIKKAQGEYGIILVDCLTLWLSNIMHAGGDFTREIDEFINILQNLNRPVRVYIVSNELGMGIVPENELARAFRDQAGRLNQRVAEIADRVYLTVSGIPVRIKGGCK